VLCSGDSDLSTTIRRAVARRCASPLAVFSCAACEAASRLARSPSAVRSMLIILVSSRTRVTKISRGLPLCRALLLNSTRSLRLRTINVAHLCDRCPAPTLKRCEFWASPNASVPAHIPAFQRFNCCSFVQPVTPNPNSRIETSFSFFSPVKNPCFCFAINATDPHRFRII